jgi:hypothetical protein
LSRDARRVCVRLRRRVASPLRYKNSATQRRLALSDELRVKRGPSTGLDGSHLTQLGRAIGVGLVHDHPGSLLASALARLGGVRAARHVVFDGEPTRIAEREAADDRKEGGRRLSAFAAKHGSQDTVNIPNQDQRLPTMSQSHAFDISWAGVCRRPTGIRRLELAEPGLHGARRTVLP